MADDKQDITATFGSTSSTPGTKATQGEEQTAGPEGTEAGPEGGEGLSGPEGYAGTSEPAASGAIYRSTPAPGGTAVAAPVVGAVSATDVWVETYVNSVTPSYQLLVKANQTYNYSPV